MRYLEMKIHAMKFTAIMYVDIPNVTFVFNVNIEHVCAKQYRYLKKRYFNMRYLCSIQWSKS